MMHPDDHPEAGGIMDLGLGQMDQQVANPPVQDEMQGQPHLGHGPHVQPTGNRDLLAATDLGHARGLSRRSVQCHVQPLVSGT